MHDDQIGAEHREQQEIPGKILKTEVVRDGVDKPGKLTLTYRRSVARRKLPPQWQTSRTQPTAGPPPTT